MTSAQVVGENATDCFAVIDQFFTVFQSVHCVLILHYENTSIKQTFKYVIFKSRSIGCCEQLILPTDQWMTSIQYTTQWNWVIEG